MGEPVDVDLGLPRPPDEAMVPCPEGLVKADDGTVGAILRARAGTAKRYSVCRARHGALMEYINGLRDPQ